MAKLYFYYASMNAGKSTTLLQADFNYRERGMETMLFTAAIDDRFEAGAITSRIGLRRRRPLSIAATDLHACVVDELTRRPLACVLVDEAQFLTARSGRLNSRGSADELGDAGARLWPAHRFPGRAVSRVARGCWRSPMR